MKRRFMPILITLVMWMSVFTTVAFGANQVAQGKCGDNVTWSLTENGVLTISGTGKMDCYWESSPAPWAAYDVKEVVIKEGVTTVENYAFYRMTSIEKVKLPSTLKIIRENAFQGCEALVQINFPEGLEEIWDDSFKDCTSLEEAILPDSLTLLRSSFAGCKSMTKTVIGDGLTIMRGNVFAGCVMLEDVTLGNSLETIGAYAFEGCVSLKEISFPDSVKTIQNSAFSGCRLERIDWGSVEVIYNEAFQGNNFEHLVLPDSVKKIGVWAFNDCSDMVSVTFGSGLKEIGDIFRDTYDLCCMTFGPNIEAIAFDAFHCQNQHLNVYFTGTEAQWNQIDLPLYDDGTMPNNPTIHFNSHIHDFKSVVTEPNCLEEGFTTYTCECGEGFVSRRTLTTECVYDGKYEVVEPTCSRSGYGIYWCSVCGKTKYVYDDSIYKSALGHILTEEVSRESTCSTHGAIETYCTRPGCTYEYITYMPLDPEMHTYGEDGFCTGCGHDIRDPFTDLVTPSSYYNAVLWAVEQNITTGISETEFGPKNPCTRAQVVTFLWRYAGSPEPTSMEHSFTDIVEGSSYYKAVLWAVERGITKGISETEFGPKEPCTRAQVVTFLWRYAGSPEPTSMEHKFKDIVEKSSYYKAVLWAVEQEITKGVSINGFGPKDSCTRAQVVTFLWRYNNNK